LRRNGFLTRYFPLRPYRSADEVFFLPDGNGALKRVDPIAAGVKRGGAVRGADGNQHAGLANLKAAEAVDDGEAVN
jgi:hypothetical protein